MAALMLVVQACQTDEQRVSGHPYICVCVFPPEAQLGDALLDVCAVTTGEAMAYARSCVEADGTAARYCDCAADDYRFCDIGACAPRQ
jgi:hypothetical protein